MNSNTLTGTPGRKQTTTSRLQQLTHMTLLLIAGEGNVDMGITGQDIVMETRLGTPNLNVNELLVRSIY